MTRLRRTSGLALFAGLAILACAAVALGRASHQRAQAAVAHRIVGLAQSELARGVHEVPDGSNNSRDIARYRTATRGAYRGAPWCAYFVSYIAKKAGVPLGWHGEGMGYVPYIRDWAHKTGRWRHTPKPGYLITFPQHIGIVEHVYSNHTLSSIEGNTSNAVRRQYHSWSSAVGYVKLADGGSIEAPAAPHPPSTTVRQPLVARMHIYPGPRATIGETLQFSAQDSSGNPVKEDWDFNGDGKWDAHGMAASHAWSEAGTFTVKLRITDSHKRTKSTTAKVFITANKPPSAELSLDSSQVHVGDRVRMDASGSSDTDGRIVKYEWDFTGDGAFVEGGSHASHTYTESGSYTVRVRVTDDSGNTAESEQGVTVAAYDPPAASIGCDRTEVASGQTVHCTSDDSQSPYRVVKHEWDKESDGHYDLRGTSVSFSYPHPGSYTLHLRVTDENGNTAEADEAIQVDDVAPTARITGPGTLKTATPLTFDASTSSDSDGHIVGYEWDTGAGFQPGGSKFTTTFSTPGSKTVRLRVTDDNGATAQTSYTFTLSNQRPTARITLPSPAHIGTQVTFDGRGSSDVDGSIVRYDWDLNGNGTYESTGATPSWTYSATGVYNVKLKVTDDHGATATVTVPLTVTDPGDAPPVVSLSVPATAFAGLPVTLSASGSADPDGWIRSYQWDLNGDGVVDTTTTSPSVTTMWAAPGTYRVTVTVVDNSYSQSSASASVAVS